MNRGNFGTFAESFMGSLGKNILLSQQMDEIKKKRKIQELLTSGNPEDIQKAYLMSGDPKGGLDYRKSIEQQGAEQELQDVVNMPEGDEKRNALSRIMFKLGKTKEGIEFAQPPFDLKKFGETLNGKRTTKIGKGGEVESITFSEGEEKPPIQSDKIQGAMAELGLDPRDPSQYTPENIARASAHLRKLEAEERRQRGEELNKYQQSMMAHNLRNELRQNKFVQDYGDVANKYEVMEVALRKAGTNPKSFVAIDQALITLYNKMTDPTSVVRESEYARTAENMSIVNRILGKMDKWRQGGAGLTNDERVALVEMGREFYGKYSKNYNQVVDDYSETARMSGINPQLIGVPFRKSKGILPSQPLGGQRPGQTSSGNRFKVKEIQ